tara:strand:- start:86 stop:451 length:366 start_codon:yes stop_codon:yes gene_type:complete
MSKIPYNLEKLEIVKDAIYRFLTETKKHNISEQMFKACFLSKGKRKGFLRDSLPQHHAANGLLLALKIESNVYKFSIANAIFLEGEQRELFLALSRDLEQISKFVALLDYDRAALESLKVW